MEKWREDSDGEMEGMERWIEREEVKFEEGWEADEECERGRWR